MQLGYTVWNWMKADFSAYNPLSDERDFRFWSEYPKRDYAVAVKTMADLGYPNIECFNFITDFYRDADAEFEKLMKMYNLKFACIYNYLTNDFDKDLEVTKDCIAFMNKHGVAGNKHMNLESPHCEEGQVTREAVDKVCKEANIIGKMCYENGIKLTLHPHFGTVIYKRSEIDYFAANTDPKYVYFCLDTAHTTIAGMDPVELFDTYANRLGYVHLKDVQPDPDNVYDKPTKRFRALGQGTVDFTTVIKRIKNKGYDGILCVELDNPIVNLYQSAQYSKQYLHYVLGLD